MKTKLAELSLILALVPCLPVRAISPTAEAYGKLPLSFEANQGQMDERVQFFSRGAGYSLFLTSSEAVLALGKPTASVLRMKLAGANPRPQGTGQGELPGKVSYFIGKDPKRWRSNIATYAKVRYEQIYRGIDLVYYGDQRELEYDFVVAPGADPAAIRIAFQGARKMHIDQQGDLVMQTTGGTVRWHKPVVYQEADGARRPLQGGYVLRRGHEVGFAVAAHDPGKPLVIDPVLVYSTYLGGGADDYAVAIAVDAEGSAYVAGFTGSTDFPTADPAQPVNQSGGQFDAFVTKLNPNGTALVYSTYLGGSTAGGTYGDDRASGIAVDASGNAYVTGGTFSIDFPTTPGAFQTTFGGFIDLWVAKLDPTGSALLYSTYLGGSDGDFPGGPSNIAIDAAGNAYVTGGTRSSNFPVTPGAFQTSLHGGQNVCVTKLNPAGSALVYSTYLGGSSSSVYDNGYSIAVDPGGNAYVVGRTTAGDFPTTVNAFQNVYGGSFDAFVTKLNAAGSALVYSSYLGGSSNDECFGVAVDNAGNAYVAGYTGSIDFPTANALQPAGAGDLDAFVAKVNATGSALVYATYLGGSGQDMAQGLTLDATGNVYVAGKTASTDFPAVHPLQSTNGGGFDAFVAKLDASGSALLFSTDLGGSGNDDSSGVTPIAVDAGGNVYLAGQTASTSFPTTNGAFQTAYGGGAWDAFVAKIATLGWLTEPSLSVDRYGATAALLPDGRAMVIGGQQPSGGALSSAELFDPQTETWSAGPSMTTPRYYHASVALADGRILAAGGYAAPGSTAAQAGAEIYDPSTHIWSAAGSLSVPRAELAIARLADGRVLAVGGNTGGGLAVASADVYNPAANTWTPVPPMSTSRRSPEAVSLMDGRVLVTGGFSSTSDYTATTEIYDPVTNSWSSGPSLSSARAFNTLTRLPDGRVLLAGGYGTGSVADAEIFDPATNSWSAAAQLAAPRHNHTATLLPDGTVLVAGGYRNAPPANFPLADSEIFNPATNTWSPAGSMHEARYGSAAVLTGQGFLVAGGYGAGFSRAADLYMTSQPATNTPPAALCRNVTVSAGPGCVADASIDDGSFDLDGGDTITLSQSPPGPFPLGGTPVTLTVTDNHGAASQCTARVTVTSLQLTALSPAAVWLGLKNSDDVGTRFDLLAELFKNGAPVGSGELHNVPGGGSGFNNAVLRTIGLTLPAPVDLCSGDTLSFRVSVRIAATSGHRAGTARLWLNDAAANSRFGATIGGVARSYYLGSGFRLSLSPGPGPKNTIDVSVDRAAGGNPFKPFGTWSTTF